MVAQFSKARQRNVARVLLMLLPSLSVPFSLCVSAHAARADAGDAREAESDAKRRAAAAYDEGVRHFERAAYAEAARAFLEADSLLPSSDALKNAMVAARRANEHLMTAIAAEKMLARSDVGEALEAQAREALAEAAQQLARVELDCAPEPCAMAVNDRPVEKGTRFVLPGMYQLSVEAAGRRKNELLKFSPGASYVLHLKLDAESDVKAVPAAPAGPARREPRAEHDAASERTRDKPLPKGVFYAGVAATAVAAGLTTWSGISALDARDDMHDPPTQTEYDETEGRIRRTDIFFAIAVGLGLATAATGVFFVDWSSGKDGAALRGGFRGTL